MALLTASQLQTNIGSAGAKRVQLNSEQPHLVTKRHRADATVSGVMQEAPLTTHPIPAVAVGNTLIPGQRGHSLQSVQPIQTAFPHRVSSGAATSIKMKTTSKLTPREIPKSEYNLMGWNELPKSSEQRTALSKGAVVSGGAANCTGGSGEENDEDTGEINATESGEGPGAIENCGPARKEVNETVYLAKAIIALLGMKQQLLSKEALLSQATMSSYHRHIYRDNTEPTATKFKRCILRFISGEFDKYLGTQLLSA